MVVFPCAGRADKGYFLAGLCVKGKIFKHGLSGTYPKVTFSNLTSPSTFRRPFVLLGLIDLGQLIHNCKNPFSTGKSGKYGAGLH